MTKEKKDQALKEIAIQIKNCTKCSLYQGANPVPGEGNSDADIVFLGEAPGFYEDQSGVPFVGRSGKLLEDSLKEIGLKRDEVWIGNMVKHRPPGNRDPLPEELLSCKGFLDQQLKIIQPRFLVTLGRFAMEKFVSGVYISKVHGRYRPIVWEDNHLLLFPMYHPAAALRNPKVMVDFKRDFVKLKNLLDKSQKDLIDQAGHLQPITLSSRPDSKPSQEQISLL